MTEPSRPHPVPGPPRPGPGRVPSAVPAHPADDAAPHPTAPDDTAPDDTDGRFADLALRPVGEHVAVFEAEHDRLTRELGTIDQL